MAIEKRPAQVDNTKGEGGNSQESDKLIYSLILSWIEGMDIK